MTTVENLVVEMQADGIGETTDQLSEADSEMESAGENMGDSADEMQSFSQKWSGAMSVIVAGLAIAAAGLLSQVPVLGGLMEGLFSVIEAVAFQMDKVLRPILQPVADGFFKVSEAIFEADGPLGTLVGVLGVIATVLAIVGAVAFKVFGVMATLSGAWGALVAVGKIVLGVIAAIASVLGLPVVAVGALIAALLALIAVFATDFMGIRTMVLEALGKALLAFKSFAGDVGDVFGEIVDNALEWGKDVMEYFAQGIKDAVGGPLDAAGKALDGVKDAISFDERKNDRMAERWGEDMLTHFGMGMERGMQREIPAQGEAIQAEDNGGASRSRSERINVSIEGRDVDKQTRRFSDRTISRRGRYS